MSLVHSARLNGHDPHVYLKDVMERLPTQPDSRIGDAAAASLATRSLTALGRGVSRRDRHPLTRLVPGPRVKIALPAAYRTAGELRNMHRLRT